MSIETTNKKVYPSQLNSKTISARIPVQDYVEFLQDSLNKGISLNDWLLMKIYNSNNKVGTVNEENELNDELLNFINNYKFEVLEVENKEEYWNSIDEFTSYEKYNNPIHADHVVRVHYKSPGGGGNYFYTIQQMLNFINSSMLYIDKLRSENAPSLMDIKVQIRALVRSKIHKNDQDEYLKEINSMLKELE